MKALMKMSNGAHTHEEALEALKNGQPIVFPTDTLFGLGVSVLHAPSPDILYAIKHREKKKPIAWLVGGIEDLERYGKMVPDFAAYHHCEGERRSACGFLLGGGHHRSAYACKRNSSCPYWGIGLPSGHYLGKHFGAEKHHSFQ